MGLNSPLKWLANYGQDPAGSEGVAVTLSAELCIP